MAASEDDEEWIQGSVSLTRTSVLFTALNVPSEFDEEDVDCRVGTTMYAATKPQNSSSSSSRTTEEPPIVFSPIPIGTLSPLLSSVKKHDPLLFKCFLDMRLVIGEPPATEAKSWRRKRRDAVEMVKESGDKFDPGMFVESGLGEGTLHGILCAALLLLELPGTSPIKSGPLLG